MANVLRETVVRRVRVREELKPMRVDGYAEPISADWLAIAQVTDGKFFEQFSLEFLQIVPATCVGLECEQTKSAVALLAYRNFETLRIATQQAKAIAGVEYVEWELCNVVVTDEFGRINRSGVIPERSIS
jgi:hypothetical protein